MIKAEDLRIGDFIRICGGYSFLNGRVCIVKRIDLENTYEGKKGYAVLGYADCIEDEWLVWCNDIEGIPLTPEILKKNGWNKKHSPHCELYFKGEGAFYIELERSNYENEKEEGFDFVVGDSTYRFGNRLKYVHELQHILWALGLNAELKI